MQGDCLEVMRTRPSESVEVVVTSPPYTLGKQKGNFRLMQSVGRNLMQTEGYVNYHDNMDINKYIEWQRDVLRECLRLIKPTGAIFYNHKPRIQKGLLDDRNNIVNDFPLRQIIIWHRDGGLNFTNTYFLPTHEYIYIIAKPLYKLKEKANAIGDVWRINAGSDVNRKSINHPCPFPAEIPRRCIASSLHNQVVLDPFCGSGTTCAVAKSLGCDYIGIELSEKYCQMARERCDNVTRFFEPLNAELF